MAKLVFKHRFDYWKSYILSTLPELWIERVKWEEKIPLLQQINQKLNGGQVCTLVTLSEYNCLSLKRTWHAQKGYLTLLHSPLLFQKDNSPKSADNYIIFRVIFMQHQSKLLKVNPMCTLKFNITLGNLRRIQRFLKYVSTTRLSNSKKAFFICQVIPNGFGTLSGIEKQHIPLIPEDKNRTLYCKV